MEGGGLLDITMLLNICTWKRNQPCTVKRKLVSTAPPGVLNFGLDGGMQLRPRNRAEPYNPFLEVIFHKKGTHVTVSKGILLKIKTNFQNFLGTRKFWSFLPCLP